jgi:hypothetical protein
MCGFAMVALLVSLLTKELSLDRELEAEQRLVVDVDERKRSKTPSV